MGFGFGVYGIEALEPGVPLPKCGWRRSTQRLIPKILHDPKYL